MERSSRKRVSFNSDSHSDSDTEEATPNKQGHRNECCRSSERIRSKTSSFQLPDRKSVFNSIKTSKSPSKSVERLKPRKLVNNFTRVTHRYNYDPVSSDDSEGADFIDDDPLSCEESDEDQEEGSIKDGGSDDSAETDANFKLKQRHHASILESESDSDDDKQRRRQNSIIESDSDDDPNELTERTHAPSGGGDEQQTEAATEATNVKVENIGDCDQSHSRTTNCDYKLTVAGVSDSADIVIKLEPKSETSDAQVKAESISETTGKIFESEPESGSRVFVKSERRSDSSSDAEFISPVPSSAKKLKKTSRKKQVLESDSESDIDSATPCKRRAVLMEDEQSDTDSDYSEPGRLYSSNEDEEKVPSERIELMEGRREVRRRLLEQMHVRKKSQKPKSESS